MSENLFDLMNPPLKGQIARGNIDLRHRPSVPNPEGGNSTVFSMSFQDRNGDEVLVPRVVRGRILSEEEAIEHYYKTGEHLGKFRTVPAAEEMGRLIHVQQETSPGIRWLLSSLKF